MSKKQPTIAKITRPKLTHVVLRERLFRLLDKGKSKPVTWIASRAGSGKTTLVASWLDSRNLPCLWYQVDQGDGDLASFFYYLGTAAKNAAPRYKMPLPLLTPEYLQAIPVFTRRYFEELFKRLSTSHSSRLTSHGCILVFDNYQDAPQDSGFNEMISHALATMPEGIRAIVLSRNDPPQPLVKLQANNLLHRIGWDDVRFSQDESGALLKAQGQGGVDRKTATLLYEKTEGWAAGLVLLMAGAGASAPAIRTAEVKTAGGIFDYFANELFHKTDETTQAVLLKTSFLSRIAPTDAEKLTGIGTAGHILERLNRNHYFTEKYDRAYQYHPLFREFLQNQAHAALSPDEIVEVRESAAGLLEKSGRSEEAVSLYLDAGAWKNAERSLLAQAGALVSQGRSTTLAELLKRFPREYLDGSGWLLYWSGISRIAYDPVEARRDFETAYRHFKQGKDVPGLFLSWAAIVDSVLYEWGDFKPLDDWIAVADDLVALHPEFPSPDIEARFIAGMLTALTWRQPYHPRLQAWADRALQVVLKSHDNQLRVTLGNHLVLYHLWVKEFSKASMDIEMLRRVSASEKTNLLMQQHRHGMEALFAWLTADGAACMQAIHDGLRSAEESGIHLLDLSLLAQGVMGGVTLGDPVMADACLAKISKIDSPRILDKALFHSMASAVAWYHGDLKQSIALGRIAIEFILIIGSPMPQAMTHIEFAVSLFDDGRHDEAKKVMNKGVEFSRGMSALEFAHMLHRARFAFDLGDEEAGLDFLRQGMTLGAKEGYVNYYRWNPDVVSRLCAIALEHGIETDYVRDLIRRRSLAPPESGRSFEHWPFPVRITTLGRFEVRKDGKPVQFAGKKKLLELLKVLVAQGGNPVREELVSDQLWPDGEGDTVHTTFKVTLSRLRSLIGADVILFQEGTFALNRGVVWSDMWSFEQLCDEACGIWDQCVRAGQERKSMVATADQLTEKAFALYRGPFLPDDMQQGWTVSRRERLRNRFLRLAVVTGRHYEDKGAWKTAAEYYRRGLDADCLQEEFYQRLMLCLHKLGQRAAAVTVYQRCRAELASKLGITPSPQTEAVYSSLLD